MRIYNRIKDFFKKNDFLKNIFLVVGGTAFAQLLTILVSPILTRIYPPEQYGVLTVCNSFLILLSISISLDYQNAIPIADNDEDACHLVIISIGFLILNTILLGFILAFFGKQFLTLFNSRQLINFRFYIIIGVFAIGMYNILIQVGYREREFKEISATKYVQSLCGNSIKIIMGISKFGALGLVLGTIIGQSAGVLRLGKILKKTFSKTHYKKNNRKIFNLIKKYKNFPLFSAPNNYIYSASSQLPVLVLTLFYGESVVGNFGLANTVVGLPFSLIGSSIGQVFYSEIARYGKQDCYRMKEESVKILKKMIIIGFFPFIILLLFAPQIFVIIFGKDWFVAGQYTQLLSISTYLSFLSYPVGRILEILSRQQIALFTNIFRLLILLASLFFSGIYHFQALHTIALYSVLNAFTYVLLISVIFIELKRQIKNKRRKGIEQ